MAVPEQTPYIEHTGNGVTTSFALKFQCESKDHLIVLVDEIEPPIATWSLSSGNVVFTTAPAAGKKITLQRNTPFSRNTDYQSYNNSFRPPAVNKDFDWIWWKLQELGVADWILGARIDALKNYVDRKDDELKAYLMEEIRKQGVALDQLDEYYNYLMERLAQIAVDKGWDASFVTYNGQTQQKVNDGLESIAELLSIEPKKGMRLFVKGLHGGWFEYSESESGTNDGGTVFNGWVRTGIDHINFDMFGLDSIGGVACDTKLLAALAASERLKLPIINHKGTYLLQSSNEFVFSQTTKLDGTVFKLGATFSGSFSLTRNDITRPIVNSGAAFDSLKAFGTLAAGRYSIATSSFDFPDHFARFELNIPLYIYRGVTKTAMFFTRLLREKRLENAPFFALDLSKLTAVHLQSCADYTMEFSGFCFDETLCNNLSSFVKVRDCNSISLKNFRYIDKNSARRTPNQTRLTVSNSYRVEVDGITDSSVFTNLGDTWSYTLTLSTSYDVIVRNVKSFGILKASVGSNLCSRVTFEDCQLTRVDFHEPCYDWLKVKNSIIGTFGISVTMIGDLYVDDCDFPIWESGGNRSYISTRSDTGGFCYGDLYLNNIKTSGWNGNNAGFIEGRGDGVLPAGSPLEPLLFRNVYIDGVYHRGTYTKPSSFYICTVEGSKLLPAQLIKLDDWNDAVIVIDYGSFAKHPETVRLDILNCNTSYVRIDDYVDKGTKVKTKIFNLNNFGSFANIVNTSNNDIDIVSSIIGKYSEYNTKWSSYSPKVKFNDCEIVDATFISNKAGASSQRIKKSNCSFVGVDLVTAFRDRPAKSKFVNCDYDGAGFLTLWSSSTAVATGSAEVHVSSGLVEVLLGWGNNKRTITINPAASGTYTIETEVTLVVTINGSYATLTLNATSANLIGFVGSK